MKRTFYTGVGSRETPFDVLQMMEQIAAALEQCGYTLRSGGAPGADSAFERAIDDPEKKHVYLPWRGFNQNRSPRFTVHPEAYALAATIHPAWGACSPAAQKLHARNVHQVLGDDLRTPSKFVVCWTRNGEPVGGTRTAIVLALLWDIPVFNLGDGSTTAKTIYAFGASVEDQEK